MAWGQPHKPRGEDARPGGDSPSPASTAAPQAPPGPPALIMPGTFIPKVSASPAEAQRDALQVFARIERWKAQYDDTFVDQVVAYALTNPVTIDEALAFLLAQRRARA